MNKSKKLKIALVGLMILMNLLVCVIVLKSPEDNKINKLSESMNELLSKEDDNSDENQFADDLNSISDFDNENIDDTNESDIDNNKIDNSIDNASDNSNNTTSNEQNSTNNNSNNTTSSEQNSINNNTTSNSSNNSSSNNDSYQNSVTQDKGYLNQMECRAYIQEKFDEEYKQNNGIYIHDGSLAFMNDNSMGSNKDENVFYIIYFLNDELPPLYALDRHELRRVVLINSVTRQIKDFGYLNGRTFAELGFSNRILK